jgi:hypothetical protein
VLARMCQRHRVPETERYGSWKLCAVLEAARGPLARIILQARGAKTLCICLCAPDKYHCACICSSKQCPRDQPRAEKVRNTAGEIHQQGSNSHPEGLRQCSTHKDHTPVHWWRTCATWPTLVGQSAADSRLGELGVRGLGGPRAGVDGLWRLCCGVAVGGPFAGGRPSVFQCSPSLLVRWGDAWGCGGGRAAAWASSGRGLLQQACGFTATQQCKSFVEMCIVSCLSASPACVCGRGAATWGCPRCQLPLPCCRDSPAPLYRTDGGWLSFSWL